MSEKNPRRIILYLVAVAAFAGIGGTLLHFSGKAKQEKLATALSEANKCLVEGYHEDDKRLALAMRYREVDLVGEWPMLCEESLAALELAAIDQKSDAGQALADAVVELKDIAKEPFIDEARPLVLRNITTKLRAVWEAAEAVGLDVAGRTEAAPKRDAPLIDLDALLETKGLATRPVYFELLGTADRDDRQTRYVVKDKASHQVSGYCSIPVHGAAYCLRLPKAIRHVKTQLVGYTELGVPPLAYVLGDDGKWSVHRAENGKRMYTGYVGGAWSTKDYVAAVTDDEGSEERIVVVEQRGLEAPTTRRKIELADIDPDATRVGDAIVIWEQVVVRTKGDFEGSRFFTIPLPLASGKIVVTKVSDGRMVDFCRAGKDVRIVPDARADCPRSGPPPRVVEERAGSLWVGASGDRTFILDLILVKGSFVDEPPLALERTPGSGLILLTGPSATYLHQLGADDSVTPIGAIGPP